MEVINQFADVLSNNISLGIITASAVGAILISLKNLPTQIMSFIQRSISYKLKIIDRGDVLVALDSWLSKKTPIMTKHFTITEFNRKNGSTDEVPVGDNDNVLKLGSGYGKALYFENGYLFFVEKIIFDKSQHVQWGIEITFFQKSFKDFILKEVVKENNIDDDCEKYLILSDSDTSSIVKTKRATESVFGKYIKILDNDLNYFLSKDALTNSMKRGVVHKRNYLLYGEPGTGKSSVIQSLASKYKLKLCYIMFNNNDDDVLLTRAIYQIRKGYSIVIEDADTVEAFKSRNENKSKLTTAAVLNLLDGVLTQHNQIVFMTTNHIEQLEPAILRSGRMDVKILFDELDSTEAYKMINYIRPDLYETIKKDFGHAFRCNSSKLSSILYKQYSKDEFRKIIENCKDEEL